jgi:predicted amidophosphoribosyltransferase
MRFVYKVHSGFDGFTPSRIPDRLGGQRRLKLNWKRYLENVELGDEVWIYFHGPRVAEAGVYLEGKVKKISLRSQSVFIRVRKYSTDRPLTDPKTSRRIADVIAVRYRQVFLLPSERLGRPPCTVASTEETCERRMCDSCETWKHLPLIKKGDYWWPPRLPEDCEEFVPAYWVIPARCYRETRLLGRGVQLTTDIFYRFKTGEGALSYPLALSICSSLKNRGSLDFDCVVPIPLSPHKARKKEIHRTRLLAKEVARLIGTRKAELLSLKCSISKRQLLSRGYTRGYFGEKYYRALSVSRRVRKFKRILLVDDVCTEGRTLGCALRRIREMNPDCEVSAATAGQMILKAVVRKRRSLRR